MATNKVYKRKTGVVNSEERAKILELLPIYTDEQIAELMNRTPDQITKMRRTSSLDMVRDKNVDSITLLRAKHYWKKIKSQLLQDEIPFFEQEWAAYNLQFQDLVHTDELTMIDTIMLTVQINRLLTQQRQALEQIELLKTEIQDEMDKDKDDRDLLIMKNLREEIASCNNNLNTINKQCESLQTTKDRKFSQLKVTREQRFKRIEESKKNIFELLKLLSEHDTRVLENRRLSLMRDATDKIKNEWMEPVEFADGTKDTILLSEDTIKQKKEEEKKDNEKSK